VHLLVQLGPEIVCLFIHHLHSYKGVRTHNECIYYLTSFVTSVIIYFGSIFRAQTDKISRFKWVVSSSRNSYLTAHQANQDPTILRKRQTDEGRGSSSAHTLKNIETPLPQIPTPRSTSSQPLNSRERPKQVQRRCERQHADRTRFTERRNDTSPKIIASPGNQYDLPPTRG